MRPILMGSILLANALGSAAMTLGRHSGTAIIGRPLDIRVQTLSSPGDDPATQCVKADVFYGDAQVSPGQVRSTRMGTGPEGEGQVRIQSLLPVNEPVVTLYVQADCIAPFTRRYVLLADPLTESLAGGSSPQRSAVPDSGVPDAVAQPVVIAGGGSQIPAMPPVGVPRTTSGRATRPDLAVASRVQPTVPRRAAGPTRDSLSRLRLEPVDGSLQLERDPVLRLSMDLMSEPASSDEARTAADLLWRSISATPEAILRDAQRLALLEAEVENRRRSEAQTQVTFAELNTRLENAESGRYLNAVVYALGGGLLLALGGVAVLWRRLRSAAATDGTAAWWAAGEASSLQSEGPPSDKKPAELDLDLSAVGDSAFGDDRLLQVPHLVEDSEPPADQAIPALSRKDRRDFAPSLIGPARSVATEELFDVQQQADFFVSLGEDEQAIRVLRNHLGESPEPSALAYLDLLMLYHRLGRRDDYEDARIEFNRMFNAGAPPFDQYTDRSGGLEAYESAFGRIQALWPMPRVLDVIEQSIFRDPSNADAEVFDLEAYRELLLLHAIAKELITRDDAPCGSGSDFQHTSVQPLKVAGKGSVADGASAAGSVSSVDRDTMPVALRLGTVGKEPFDSEVGTLDLDLSEMPDVSGLEASYPNASSVTEPIDPLASPGTGDLVMDNLIDFSVLDFVASETPPPAPPQDRKG